MSDTTVSNTIVLVLTVALLCQAACGLFNSYHAVQVWCSYFSVSMTHELWWRAEHSPLRYNKLSLWPNSEGWQLWKTTNIVTVISQHATEWHTSDIHILWQHFMMLCVCVCVCVCVCTLSQYLHTIQKLCDNSKALWHTDNVELWTGVQEWGWSICECMNWCSRVRLLNVWMWQLNSRTRTNFKNSYQSAQVIRLLYSPGAKVMFSYAQSIIFNK